jgi:hypothetical protein
MMTGSRLFMYTLVAVAAGAIAVACGGSSSRRLTKAQYANKANELCKQYRARIAPALANPAQLENPATLARIVKGAKSFARGLSRLKPPSDEENAVNDFRATIGKVQSSAAQLSAAIQKGARATATKMATELKIEAATLAMEANSLGITCS